MNLDFVAIILWFILLNNFYYSFSIMAQTAHLEFVNVTFILQHPPDQVTQCFSAAVTYISNGDQYLSLFNTVPLNCWWCICLVMCLNTSYILEIYVCLHSAEIGAESTSPKSLNPGGDAEFYLTEPLVMHESVQQMLCLTLLQPFGRHGISTIQNVRGGGHASFRAHDQVHLNQTN